jgi:hypothetical protein
MIALALAGVPETSLEPPADAKGHRCRSSRSICHGSMPVRVFLRLFSPVHIVQRTVKFVAFSSDLGQARLFGPLALAGAMSHTALTAG